MPVVETSVDDVHRYFDLFESLGIAVWIGGGWGVDALLRSQTRQHRDLDIVVQQADTEALVDALVQEGHVHVPGDDTRPWNFVMGDQGVSEIDFHVVVFDARGNGIYGPAANGDVIPAPAFEGLGEIGGRRVRCMSAEFQVSSHTGYALKEKDIADVFSLAARFGVELTAEHNAAARAFGLL